jgi:hypothetical protein
MRIDFKWTTTPLLAVLVVACSGLADPGDRAGPSEEDSMFTLEPPDDDPSTDPLPQQLPPAGRACEAAGQAYPSGTSVPSGDSCNGCVCYDGSIVCTAAVCEPIVCAQVVEDSNGVCSRFPLDPCISQDPDCGSSSGGACEAAGQSFPDGSDVPSGDACNRCSCNDGTVSCSEVACEPVVCTQMVEASDGVCSRFPLDPCIFQDPDCGSSSEGSCEAAGQSFPDGSEVPSGDSCNGCGCYDGTVICTELACEPVFCAEFVEESDGLCSRFLLDPCISQDPDCGTGAGACEVAGQRFPNGSDIPAGDTCNRCSCSEGAVICTDAACEPVVCAEFVEEVDGVCSRFPLDPCTFQDPDCLSERQ